MKLRAAAAILLLLACAAARAQGKPVELIDGHLGIDFVPPKGAVRLGEDEAARLASAGSILKVAFGGPGSGTLLTVNTFSAEAKGVPDGASEKERQALMKRLEWEAAAAFPAAELMAREVVRIDGPFWVRLRYKLPTKTGGQVVADTYAITWVGRVAVFNYLCPAADYERRRAAFEKSAASIRLTLFALGPPREAKPRGRRP
ncbi:MAG TPA: hypothetical protein VF591_02600 [Pyrinomonadaceae bacterium]|jgi:hypothetical protein